MEERTISAHVDIATASRINHLAKTEQRQTSEIAEMALKFKVI
jgi:predicted transcriptional regulator